MSAETQKGIERNKLSEAEARDARRAMVKAMLATVPEDARLLFGHWRGDPKTMRGFAASPYIDGESALKGGLNLYLTVSSFRTCSKTGKWRRKKASFAAGHAFMIDDVVPSEEYQYIDGKGRVKGTPLSKLDRLPPTALIETSPNNYQALYILREAETNRATFDAAIRALVKETGGDNGAKDVSRIFRPAYGTNMKDKHRDENGMFHVVRMLQWNGDRLYTTEEIIKAFDLKLNVRPAFKSKRIRGERATRIWIWEQVMRVLGQKGLLFNKEDTSGEWYRITCPFEAGWERPDGAKITSHGGRLGTTIGAPSADNDWHGSFVCHHDEHSPDPDKHQPVLTKDEVIPRWRDVLRWALPHMPPATRSEVKTRLARHAAQFENKQILEDIASLEKANADANTVAANWGLGND